MGWAMEISLPDVVDCPSKGWQPARIRTPQAAVHYKAITWTKADLLSARPKEQTYMKFVSKCSDLIQQNASENAV